MALACVGLVVAAGVVGSAPAQAGVAASSAVVPTLTWRSCGTPLVCASARVPLDWSHPTGRSITLALAKLPATDKQHRIGTLFVNPGGPGDSGANVVRDNPDAFPAAVRRRFDIVGFDPRFVGGSRPLATCMNDDAFEALVSTDPIFPLGADAEERFAGHDATFSSACATRSELGFSSTASVARDLDALRQAVGDTRLSYLGYSYGTYLGQVYAELFPNRLRAMVLDGVIDAPAWAGGTDDAWRYAPFSARIGSAHGSSQTWRQFLRLCQAAGPSRCALDRQGDPGAAFDRLAQRLRGAPVDFGGGDVLDYASLVSATTSVMYSPMDWQGFSFELQGLYQAVFTPTAAASAAGAGAGTGTRTGTATKSAAKAPSAALRRSGLAVLRRSRSVSQRFAAPWERPQATQPAPFPEPLPYDSSQAAFSAVACEDSLNPDHYSHWASTADALDDASPYFGREWTWPSLVCATWPFADPNAYRGHFGRRLSAPMLVLTTRYDPATPYEGAVATTARYPGSRLLTVQGYGHTSQAAPSRCVDAAVSAYLVSGVLPAKGAACRQDWVVFPA